MKMRFQRGWMFMKGKLVLMLVMLIMLAGSVNAFDKIFVVDFNYNQGDIIVNDKLVKYGHYPDRKIQPTEGHIVEIISDTDELLYSFKFEVPLKIWVDSSDENKLSGGYIILDNVDFALVMPYFDNAAEIRIYEPDGSSKGKLELIADVAEVKLSQSSKFITVGSGFGLVLLLLLLLFIRKKRAKVI